MRFTILGSNGFIGTHLQRFLSTINNSEVICPQRGERLRGDENYGTIFYCVGMTGDFKQQPMATVESHVTLLKDVVTRTRFDGLVYLSSTRIYGRSNDTTETAQLTVNPAELSDIYNISKIMGEAVCLHSGQSGVKVVRLSNVFDYTFSNPVFTSYLMNQAIAGKPLKLQSHLDSAKDYITIDKVVELLYKIATTGNQPIYNLASGTNVSHQALVTILQSRFDNLAVEVAPESPMVTNQPIDISRIQHEFDFRPEPFARAFAHAINEKIVCSANENHD